MNNDQENSRTVPGTQTSGKNPSSTGGQQAGGGAGSQPPGKQGFGDKKPTDANKPAGSQQQGSGSQRAQPNRSGSQPIEMQDDDDTSVEGAPSRGRQSNSGVE